MDPDVEVVEEIVAEGTSCEDVDKIENLKKDVGDLGGDGSNSNHYEYSNARVDELVIPFHPALRVDAQMEPLEQLEVRSRRVLFPFLEVLAHLRVGCEVGHVQVEPDHHKVDIDVDIVDDIMLWVYAFAALVQDVGWVGEQGDTHDFPSDDEEFVGEVVVNIIAQARTVRQLFEKHSAEEADGKTEGHAHVRDHKIS